MCTHLVKLSPEDDILILTKGSTIAAHLIGTSRFVLANRVAKLKKCYKDIYKLADLYNGSEILRDPHAPKRVQKACKKYFEHQYKHGEITIKFVYFNE